MTTDRTSIIAGILAAAAASAKVEDEKNDSLWLVAQAKSYEAETAKIAYHKHKIEGDDRERAIAGGVDAALDHLSEVRATQAEEAHTAAYQATFESAKTAVLKNFGM